VKSLNGLFYRIGKAGPRSPKDGAAVFACYVDCIAGPPPGVAGQFFKPCVQAKPAKDGGNGWSEADRRWIEASKRQTVVTSSATDHGSRISGWTHGRRDGDKARPGTQRGKTDKGKARTYTERRIPTTTPGNPTRVLTVRTIMPLL